MDRRCMGCMELYSEEYEVCPHCGFLYGEKASEAYHLSPGTILHKKYIVGKTVGFGGFGVTYIGWDALLEKKVAIKEYFPGEFATRMPEQSILTVFSGDREEQFQSGMIKFVEEARRLAKFQDEEGIVSVYDSFEENKTAYIVMEYLDGESLKEKLNRDGNMSIDEALPIIKTILTSLEKVHAEGIIHRDIAPDNIHISKDGSVKLIDFGASRFATTKHSKSLSVILKPGYSPEEQYRSRGDQGPWTDVYSVAATFYKMLTGVTPTDAMERAVKDTVKEPSKLGAKLPKSIENALMNAMNTKIEGRTQSAQAFIDELEAAEVKRIKIKEKKIDIGKWPLWAKISSGVATSAVACFGVLLTTGVIQFNIASLGYSSVPIGMTRVPNLINMSAEKAETFSADADLVYQVYGKEYSNEIPEGMVLAQNMIGGSVVDEGKTIAVILSAGVEPTYVPSVVGCKEAVANEAMLEANLVNTNEEGQSKFAPGTVASQSVEPGLSVDSGSNIDLIISTGVENYDSTVDTSIPDVVGISLSNALTASAKNKVYLYVAEYTYNDSIEKDIIISQDKAPNSVVKEGDEFGVVVSLGKEMIKVPDVQYMTMSEAKSSLESIGLSVSVEYVEDEVVAKDSVVKQSVEADKQVEKGSKITIYVSKGNSLADDSIKASDINVTKEVQESIRNTDSEENSNNGISVVLNTKNNKVSVPSVIGQTSNVAQSQLQSSGLNTVVSYKHSDSVANGCVISQSSSGGEVAKGTTISIVVCNNEKVTQYRTRSIGEEITESNSNVLEGWSLYDTSWSDYGGWSNWSTTPVNKSDSRNVEMKTQYRYQDKQYKTANSTSLSGYALVSNTPISESLGNWGGVQTSTSKPNISYSLKGNQPLTQITNQKSTYNYFHYHNRYTDGKEGIDSTNVVGAENGGTKIASYIKTCSLGPLSEPLPKVTWPDVGGKQAYKKVGAYNCKYNNFNYWWLSSSTTTYTFRTRPVTYTYNFYKWGNWSGWQDAPVTANNNRQVQTQVLYRYQDRYPIYHFKRTVYGNWSNWMNSAASPNSTLDVQTREVYKYE